MFLLGTGLVVGFQLQTKSQELPPPHLTVDPLITTEHGSITLHCQNPASVFNCFYTFDELQPKTFPCLHILNGGELLLMVNRRAPSGVSVRCFYVKVSRSQLSNQRVITTFSSLTDCGTFSDHRNGESHPALSASSLCLCISVLVLHHEQIKDATVFMSPDYERIRLLKLSQNVPAEVQVQCLMLSRERQFLHLHRVPEEQSSLRGDHLRNSKSGTGSKPEIQLQHYNHQMQVSCILPVPATGSTCNLFFGESERPYLRTSIWKKTDIQGKQMCKFSFSFEELDRFLEKVELKNISCDYYSDSDPGLLSTRSDEQNLTIFLSRLESSQLHVTLDPENVTETNSEAPTYDNSDLDLALSSTTVPTATETSLTTAKPPVAWTVLVQFVRTLMAVSLLLALSFCCLQILSDTVNSKDPNSEALKSDSVIRSDQSERWWPERGRVTEGPNAAVPWSGLIATRTGKRGRSPIQIM
ncbi:hypothetical protein WMY93_033149 [Mugilogobius chulae]|uniref:Uncharacterized protein n=1 Tax=Mugilogobius chulae TaxID=88201 RepID=A0AAW0MTK7_9GOBI